MEEENIFKSKKLLSIVLCTIFASLILTGCAQSQADKVSSNLSLEADNFNVIRRLTVINGILVDALFQMTGKIN